MTEAELDYIAGSVEPPPPPKPRHHQIRQVDYPRRRYDPADAPLARDWRVTPTAINCDHGHDDSRFICEPCEDMLYGIVADTARLMHDLELAYTKQVEFLDQGAPVEADPDESPLEWHQAASNVIRDMRAAYGGPPVERANWMLNHWPLVQRDPTLPRLAAKISEATVHAHQIIDRPPTLMDYGPCPTCGTRIQQERITQGDPDKQIVCSTGDYTANLHDHQVTQVTREELIPKTAGQIQEALKIIGEPITKSQWDNMVTRDGLPRERQVIPHWVNGKLETSEVWGYRLKDVRDMRKTRRDVA